jgi:hemolysin activation/secretion protein
MAARWTQTFGLDPRRLRVFGDLRVEGASGDFTYLRGALDLTLSRAITQGLAGALTLSGGTTTGELPVQRMFYLGGTQTVRGQVPGTNVGPAYWMARAELGSNFLAARPVLFYDVGWAGERGDWRHPGQPMSGAGVGASFLDGLARLDLARGIRPRERWTMNFYLDAVF